MEMGVSSVNPASLKRIMPGRIMPHQTLQDNFPFNHTSTCKEGNGTPTLETRKVSLGRSNYLCKDFSQAQKWQTLDNPLKEKIYAQKSSKNNLSDTEWWVPCKHSWVRILHLIIKNCWYSPPFNLQKGLIQMIWTITLGIPEMFLGEKSLQSINTKNKFRHCLWKHDCGLEMKVRLDGEL